MALLEQDLLALLKREKSSVVYERRDPRWSYEHSEKEINENEISEKEIPELEEGRTYSVDDVDISFRGNVCRRDIGDYVISLLESQSVEILTEASRVKINGSWYSAFCFRLC